MAKAKSTILESWPALKNDLINFLTDTDEWIMMELRKAYDTKDWERVSKVIDVMESVHEISHSH